jgi:hypothetical protein
MVIIFYKEYFYTYTIFLNLMASRSVVRHTVGLLREPSAHHKASTYTGQHNIRRPRTNIHALRGSRPRLGQRGHWIGENISMGGKYYERRTFERPKGTWEDNIKINLRKQLLIASTNTGLGWTAIFCGHGNVPYDSAKGGKVTGHLRNYQLFKEGSVLCNKFVKTMPVTGLINMQQ